MPSELNSKSRQVLHLLFFVLIAGLFTGTLDAIAAALLNFHTPMTTIWRFIASGVFGKEAFDPQNTHMVVYGVLLHYFIAYSFSSALLLWYPIAKIIFRFKYLIGIMYGMLIWCIMNLIIVPLSNTPKTHFHIKGALLNMLALILAVGIPSSLMAYRYYASKNKKGCDVKTLS